MELQTNTKTPSVMHVDLNSCFAIVEQQANPFLRGVPVGVAAYTGASGCVISPSYEAKREGVKVGMRVSDAKQICPEIRIIPPDPPKYRAVHQMFCRIFKDYTPVVVPKSIDEAVLDFDGMNYSLERLIKIGREIKLRMKLEIGEWITCNVGISTNRFLAKTAASLHKPDGLDVITHENVRDVLGKLDLIDLCGINVRYKFRLNAHGIYTPLQFLDSSSNKLKKEVFKSIVGYYWYMRLRGWEIDQTEFGRKSYGQSYALHHYTNNKDELCRLLMKLCEKMGRRLRKAAFFAKGIHIGVLYSNGQLWHVGRKTEHPLYSTLELYNEAKKYLITASHLPVTHIFVSCFNLHDFRVQQLDLLDSGKDKRWRVSRSLDVVNNRYGEYVVLPSATMKSMEEEIIDRVPFGGIKELEELYAVQQI